MRSEGRATLAPCPSWSVFERRSASTRPSSVSATSSDIERGEFGAAEAAGETDYQQRPVAGALQIRRQRIDHLPDLRGKERLFAGLSGTDRPFDALEDFAHAGMLGGSGRGMPGRLMGFRDGGQAPDRAWRVCGNRRAR